MLPARERETFVGVLDDSGPIPASDPVNAPPHYTKGEIECFDAIKAALTPEELWGYCKGNVMKYLWRERHKGGDTDIAKAMWYLLKMGAEK